MSVPFRHAYKLEALIAKKTAVILDREYIRLPLWLYDHSGISISTGEREWPYNCQWDSGQVGIIYISLAKAKETFLSAEELTRIEDKGWETLIPARGEDEPKKLIQAATECLYAEVKTYDDYLTGNAWGFAAYGLPAKDGEDGEVIGSNDSYLGDDGWNFRNEDSYMVQEAKEMIDSHIAELEAAEEAKKRSVSTLDELAAITPCPELAMTLFHHIGFDDNSQLGELTRTLADARRDLEKVWRADIPGFLNDEDASSFFTHNINRIMLLAIDCSKEAGESLSSFMSKIPFGGAHDVHEIDRWLCSSIRGGSIGIKFDLLALREIANACRYAVLK